MKLTVIGCSGSGPGPDSPASCYLVEADGYRLLLDLGAGALGALQRRLPPHEIDGIVLTHLHPDHCIDMLALWIALEYGPYRPRRGVSVIAPPGAEQHLARAYGPPADSEGFGDAFTFAVHPTGVTELGPFVLRFARAAHPLPAVSVRVEHDGRSLTYSGDTGPNAALDELAAGTDMLLCEAGWGGAEPDAPDVHMTGLGAGRLATTAGVGRLVITHVPPWGSIDAAVSGAQSAFDGVVVPARAGQVHEV